jgi:hypothetical protein
MRIRVLWRAALACGLGLTSMVAAGCYTYTPLQTLEPVPDTRVALVLSDQGRVGAGPNIGSSVARVEGALVASSETEYTLRVAAVTDIRGALSRWTGETVTLRRTWVGDAYERRLSKSRTGLLVGALTAGFVAFIATRTLAIGGGPLEELPPGGGGGEQ